MNMEIQSKSEYILVAAIDIGVVCSRYGFSLKCEWGRVLSKFSNSCSNGDLISCDVPTCLLLKKDLSESLFGNEAKDKYSQLKSEGSHYDFHFFQNFTMILHQGVSKINLSLSLSENFISQSQEQRAHE